MAEHPEAAPVAEPTPDLAVRQGLIRRVAFKTGALALITAAAFNIGALGRSKIDGISLGGGPSVALADGTNPNQIPACENIGFGTPTSSSVYQVDAFLPPDPNGMTGSAEASAYTQNLSSNAGPLAGPAMDRESTSAVMALIAGPALQDFQTNNTATPRTRYDSYMEALKGPDALANAKKYCGDIYSVLGRTGQWEAKAIAPGQPYVVFARRNGELKPEQETNTSNKPIAAEVFAEQNDTAANKNQKLKPLHGFTEVMFLKNGDIASPGTLPSGGETPSPQQAPSGSKQTNNPSPSGNKPSNHPNATVNKKNVPAGQTNQGGGSGGGRSSAGPTQQSAPGQAKGKAPQGQAPNGPPEGRPNHPHPTPAGGAVGPGPVRQNQPAPTTPEKPTAPTPPPTPKPPVPTPKPPAPTPPPPTPTPPTPTPPTPTPPTPTPPPSTEKNPMPAPQPVPTNDGSGAGPSNPFNANGSSGN